MSKNDITGDNIKSKIASKEYEDNYDKIFRNKSEANQPVERPKYCYKLCKQPDCACVPDWDDARIKAIGQNGNEGLHYAENDYEQVEKDYKND